MTMKPNPAATSNSKIAKEEFREFDNYTLLTSRTLKEFYTSRRNAVLGIVLPFLVFVLNTMADMAAVQHNHGVVVAMKFIFMGSVGCSVIWGIVTATEMLGYKIVSPTTRILWLLISLLPLIFCGVILVIIIVRTF